MSNKPNVSEVSPQETEDMETTPIDPQANYDAMTEEKPETVGKGKGKGKGKGAGPILTSKDPLTAAKKSDAMTAAVRKPDYTGMPMVTVTLPLPPEGEDGLERDVVERITHNGYKYEIKRGYPVEIPVPVYMILKQGKYKNIRI